MALYLILLLALAGIARTRLPARDLTPRIQGPVDPPFTFKFCDTNRPPCEDCPGGTVKAGLVDLDVNTADLFPSVEVTLTQAELDKYRALEMEYVVEFSKNPPFSEKPVELPFCGIDQVQRKKKRSFVSDLFGKPPKRPVFKPRCLPTQIAVVIYFNIITSNSTTGSSITDEAIFRQLDVLHEAYIPLNISFRNGGIRRFSSSLFRQFTHQKFDTPLNSDEQAYQDKIMGQLRQGSYEDINIYIVEQIDDTRCIDGRRSRTDGYCPFPKSPPDTLHDGCFVDIDSLPGVAFRRTPNNFGTGTTLVHEIGHWFGLTHIFHSARPGDKPGVKPTCSKAPDYLGVETPFYPGPGQFDAFQFPCCQLGKDQFGNCAFDRKDHVTNWMSYSQDKGKVDLILDAFPWTKGQKADIFTKFFSMRKQFKGVNCDDGGPIFVDGIAFKNKKRDDGDGDRNVTGQLRELLRQPPALLESLKTICAEDPDKSKDVDIDPATGELVKVNDGPLGWWYKLGVWRWVVLAAAIIGLLIVFFCSVCCCWRWKKKRSYTKVRQREGDKFDDVRMAPLLLGRMQHEHHGA